MLRKGRESERASEREREGERGREGERERKRERAGASERACERERVRVGCVFTAEAPFPAGEQGGHSQGGDSQASLQFVIY